jgi:hypothetical protein
LKTLIWKKQSATTGLGIMRMLVYCEETVTEMKGCLSRRASFLRRLEGLVNRHLYSLILQVMPLRYTVLWSPFHIFVVFCKIFICRHTFFWSK